MNFIDEIEALFDIYENEEFLTEEEIFERCIGVAQKYSWNRDVLFDLNDSLNFHGYTYQFKIEKEKRREFDINTYSSLIKNVKISPSFKGVSKLTCSLFKYALLLTRISSILPRPTCIDFKYSLIVNPSIFLVILSEILSITNILKQK